MIINSLDNDSRRILISASQAYEAYLDVDWNNESVPAPGFEI